MQSTYRDLLRFIHEHNDVLIELNVQGIMYSSTSIPEGFRQFDIIELQQEHDIAWIARGKEYLYFPSKCEGILLINVIPLTTLKEHNPEIYGDQL